MTGRSVSVVIWFGIVAGCGGQSQQADEPQRREGGVAYHLAESERHEREAIAHEREIDQDREAEPETFTCRDDRLETVSYSGTEPYQVMRPCWTAVIDPDEQYREEARRHRREAAWHRERAERLVVAEGRACANLGAAEIARSPLTRAEDIVRVESVERGGQEVGAVIVLRRVPGLSAEWLARSLSCHQTRAAALGYPTGFMGDCPMTLPGVQVEIEEVSDGFAVTLVAPREEIAAAVLGRARDLVAE